MTEGTARELRDSLARIRREVTAPRSTNTAGPYPGDRDAWVASLQEDCRHLQDAVTVLIDAVAALLPSTPPTEEIEERG